MTSNMTQKIIFPVAKYDNKPCSGWPKETKVIYKVHKTTFFTQYTIQTESLFFFSAQKQVFWIWEVFQIDNNPSFNGVHWGKWGIRLKQRAKLKMVITQELIHGLS